MKHHKKHLGTTVAMNFGPALGSLRRLMRFGRDASGTFAVEFAIAAPIMVLLAIGGIDFGRGFQQKHRIVGAAQAAAQFAVQRDRESAQLAVADVEQRAKDDAADNSLNVAAEYFCVCPGTTAEVACTTTCAVPRPPSTYVRVTVQDTVDFIFDYPGVADTLPLTSVATMRIR
jgi:Flp pilus assembly protein TadG